MKCLLGCLLCWQLALHALANICEEVSPGCTAFTSQRSRSSHLKQSEGFTDDREDDERDGKGDAGEER